MATSRTPSASKEPQTHGEVFHAVAEGSFPGVVTRRLYPRPTARQPSGSATPADGTCDFTVPARQRNRMRRTTGRSLLNRSMDTRSAADGDAEDPLGVVGWNSYPISGQVSRSPDDSSVGVPARRPHLEAHKKPTAQSSHLPSWLAIC